MEEKTSTQMQCYHNLAKEKAAFVTWLEQFKMDCVTHQTWRSVLRQERFSLLSDIRQIFPIHDLAGKRPTLRWITLPPTDEIKECVKDETQLSVIVGDVAHVIFVIARILGTVTIINCVFSGSLISGDNFCMFFFYFILLLFLFILVERSALSTLSPVNS